jgi:hypothetical protein
MQGMKNPFNYLQFATGDNFFDRKEIYADLRSRILSGTSNVVLYGDDVTVDDYLLEVDE